MLKDHKKDSNQERYKTLGYKQPFDGKAGSGSWSELIESMKTNVLRLNLRQRKLVMGKYTAQAGAAGDMKPLATIPEDWSESWDVTAKRNVSVALQDEREQDLIHMGKSAKEIESDKETALFKSCAFQIARLKDDKEVAYEYWWAITSGEVRSKIEIKGVSNVNEIFNELKTDYGQAQERELREMINLFKTGKPKGVSTLPEQLDMRRYLDSVSAGQDKIKHTMPVESRDSAEVLTEKTWIEIVVNALPTIYEDVILDCRKEIWTANVMGMDDAGERQRLFEEGEDSYKKTPLVKKSLRASLLKAHEKNVRRWKEQEQYKPKVATVLAVSAPKRTMRMVAAVGLAMRPDTYLPTAPKTVETVERAEVKVDVDVVKAVAVAKVDVVARVAEVDPRSENPAGNVKKLLDTTSLSLPKVTFPVGCG